MFEEEKVPVHVLSFSQNQKIHYAAENDKIAT